MLPIVYIGSSILGRIQVNCSLGRVLPKSFVIMDVPIFKKMAQADHTDCVVIIAVVSSAFWGNFHLTDNPRIPATSESAADIEVIVKEWYILPSVKP